MRSVVYFVAVSIDGFIAHPDGTWDGFLPEGEHVADYLATFDRFDTVLMGRKTYQIGVDAGKTDPYPMMDSYVFSRTMEASPDNRVTLVSDDAAGAVRALKAQEGRPIYLCGGSELAATLFEEGLIDEIVLKVNPVVLGEGIPLFARPVDMTALDLVKSRVYANGCVWLTYRVQA